MAWWPVCRPSQDLSGTKEVELTTTLWLRNPVQKLCLCKTIEIQSRHKGFYNQCTFRQNSQSSYYYWFALRLILSDIKLQTCSVSRWFGFEWIACCISQTSSSRKRKFLSTILLQLIALLPEHCTEIKSVSISILASSPSLAPAVRGCLWRLYLSCPF